MSAPTYWETIKVEGGQLLDKVKQLLREGNVRRIVITQNDRTVAEFPLTIGVVGAVFAPVLAAVGAIAALITDCSIAIEREKTAAAPGPEGPSSAGPATDTSTSAGTGTGAGPSTEAPPDAPPSNVHPFPPGPSSSASEPPSPEPPTPGL